jgi:tetratricopeptide (TPR) repeat protein
MGEYDNAIKCLLDALKTRENLESKLSWNGGFVLSNLGNLSIIKGELDQAMSYLEEALQIATFYSHRKLESDVFRNMGRVMFEKGKFDQAEKYLIKSLEHSRLAHEPEIIAHSYIELISLYVETGKLEQANQFLMQFGDYASQTPSSAPVLLYQFAQTLILLESKRMKDKGRAQRILEHLVKKEQIPEQIRVYVILFLTEIMIEELLLESDDALLCEAQELTNDLYTRAQRNYLIPMIIRSLIIKSKFQLVAGYPIRADKILEDAMALATERGLNKLIAEISGERRQLEEKIELWQGLSLAGVSLEERIRNARLKEYLNKALTLSEINL